jgi:hypothetical protein
MTHDYLRNGPTRLFYALDALGGTVRRRCMQRPRHQEFLRVSNTIKCAVPRGQMIQVIMYQYGSH